MDTVIFVGSCLGLIASIQCLCICRFYHLFNTMEERLDAVEKRRYMCTLTPWSVETSLEDPV